MLVLAAAGTSALRLTLPVTLAIVGLLAVFVVLLLPGHRGRRASSCCPWWCSWPQRSPTGVPVFRQPRARRAQRAELMLGALLRSSPSASIPKPGKAPPSRAELGPLNPGVRLDTLDSPHRSLVHPIVGYVRRAQQPRPAGRCPDHRGPAPPVTLCRILQNQRDCSWPPSCAPAPTPLSSAPSPTGSPSL